MAAAARPTRAAPGWLTRELAATLALSWPIVLANLAINAMTLTDLMMLGWLSPRALAAGALGYNLYLPPFLLGSGLVAALSPIAAAKIGAAQGADALRRATHQALLSAIIIALVTWLALWHTASILKAIGEEPELADDAGTYMLGFQWSLAPSLLFFAARAAFFALERPRPALFAGLVAVGFNALANYALIFGKLGMPALGIFGSGLATTLSQTLMVSHAPRRRARRPAHAPVASFRASLAAGGARTRGAVAARSPDRGDNRSRGRRILCVHPACRPHRQGGAGSAHHRLQIASFAFMVPLGLGQAATVRVGHAYGAGDASRFTAPGGRPSA